MATLVWQAVGDGSHILDRGSNSIIGGTPFLQLGLTACQALLGIFSERALSQEIGSSLGSVLGLPGVGGPREEAHGEFGKKVRKLSLGAPGTRTPPS